MILVRDAAWLCMQHLAMNHLISSTRSRRCLKPCPWRYHSSLQSWPLGFALVSLFQYSVLHYQHLGSNDNSGGSCGLGLIAHLRIDYSLTGH
jgi:hypothetical protein